MWFYAAKPHVQKQLRHSRNKKMYTEMHFDTTLIFLFLCIFCCGCAATVFVHAALPQNKDKKRKEAEEYIPIFPAGIRYKSDDVL
jgi:hypothetical protein